MTTLFETLDGGPVPVGPWYPYRHDHRYDRLPDPDAQPDFLEKAPMRPEKGILTWGDRAEEGR